MNHDTENFDRKRLIDDFLNDFSQVDRIDLNPIKSFRSVDATFFDDQDYEQAIISEEEEKRIRDLQELTRRFENESRIDFHAHFEKPEEGLRIAYKELLNPGQYYAVTTLDKPLLVIAGAGSGKTRVIIYRVGYLLEKGVDPAQILLLTFTRKAAGEMINRTIQLLGNNQAERIMAGTFHSFSNYCIRRYANLIGIQPKFNIIDTVDAEDIIALIRDELVKKRNREFPTKKRLQEIISKSKNCVLPVEEVIEHEYSGLIEYINEIRLIAETYEKYKTTHLLYDYDDLLEVMAKALKENGKFRRRMQEQYRYVMVDEFQDTNIFQKEIVDCIASGHRRIMVVGDDSQSIYGFRGAHFENILKFPQMFPDGEIVKIEQNYRSHQQILDFTNAIVGNAKLGYRKTLFSENLHDNLPEFRKFYDQEDEAVFIVNRILELREKNIPYKEMAILVRASFHGNYIQAELLKRSIPYVVVGGIRFTERRHIRDIIAFLRILMNPLDASAWHRVLKLLPGIGDISAKNIIREIRSNEGKLPASQFAGKKYGAGLDRLQRMLIEAASEELKVSKKIEIISEYYAPVLKLLEDEYEKRMLDIDVLFKLSQKYMELEKFLSDFALDPPSNKFQDGTSPLITEPEEDPVTVSTIHSAKGLEWHTVFVPHLIDGLFPTARALTDIEEMEEERRLFYVASTRARENLYLSMPSWFVAWDKTFTKPSRFMAEIDRKHFKVCDT
jgi:DNA helicase II / ATP-dependent DNA helicase PcrA